MKRIISCLIALTVALAITIGIGSVGAFAATYDGKTTVYDVESPNIGDKIYVKFKFSSSQKIAYMKAYVNYDVKYFEFIESEASVTDGTLGTNPNASGKLMFSIDDDGFTSTTLTLCFKAKAVGGPSYIGIRDSDFVDVTGSNEEPMSIEGAGINITVVNKSAQKSSNANLSNIVPSSGSLTPSFNPNTTTYSVTIKNNVTTLLVTAYPADKGATWDVEGSKEMKVGSNKRVIVVTAADGTQKRYTLNVTRLASDGSTPDPDIPDTENPVDNKVSVTADGKDMYISNEIDISKIYEGFKVNSYSYNGVEFPCIERGDTTLLYLTDPNGENADFYRPLADGSFESFKYFVTATSLYEFIKPEKAPEGYETIEININGFKVTGYKNSNPAYAEFVLLYARGPEKREGFYYYDTVEGTLQRATDIGAWEKPVEGVAAPEDEGDKSFIERIFALDTGTKVVAICIVGIIILLIVAIIILIVKIAGSARDDEEDFYEEDDETEEDESMTDFDFISISDRDTEDNK